MILETAQILSVAHHINGLNINQNEIYKPTHINHPCCIWARKSKENYYWLCNLGIKLCNEYTFRYSKSHKTESILVKLSNNLPLTFPESGLTTFAMAIPDNCKTSFSELSEIENVIASYRNYYIKEKSHIAVFSKRTFPYWFK